MQQRTIKSFVLRTGRVSNRQQIALDNWLKDYELPMTESRWDITSLFGRKAETIVEIGFGMGSSLLAMAKQYPEYNFIGIEVHRAGIGSLVAELHNTAVANVRVVPHDAVQILKERLPPESLAGVQIFFLIHGIKKDITNAGSFSLIFVTLLVQNLKKGGFIHCATDWQDYADHMETVFSAEPQLTTHKTEGEFIPLTRITTKFEARGKHLGHDINDLVYYKS